MPRNPMLSSGRDAQNVGVNRPDRAAEPHKSYIQKENEFDLSHSQFATLRYADVHPFFFMDALPSDQLPFRSFHELRSYTLQSPMLSDLKLHKSFTMVPMEAILPNTWERFIVNPTKGDDVPEDVYCRFPVVGVAVGALAIGMAHEDIPSRITDLIKSIIVCESVFSSGSLLASLAMDFSKCWPDFDTFFDTVFVPFIKVAPISVDVNMGDVTYSVTLNQLVADLNSSIMLTNVHDFLDILRDGAKINYALIDDSSYEAEYTALMNYLFGIDSIFSPSIQDLPEFKFDISKPIAYQLSCVQIMTDDSIDDIFTPALFRDMIYELTDPKFFTYNGSPVQYDAFSEAVLFAAVNPDELMSVDKIYQLYTLLFSYRKSLKYGDYFIDARPEPYAVGDMSAEVKDGSVSAIDSTRSILAQRFLNWSNRVGNKLHDYILALTGVVPTARTTEPKYIIHEVFDVNGFEVENTGSEQRDNVSVTTHLKTQDSRYMFDIQVNDYCIILGLAHFDVKRIYSGGVDRSNLKSNRFDYFNKFFQYAGDQDIKRIELSSALMNPDDAMAYTTRHMQYKTAVSRAVGGFTNGSLPSWAFVNDETKEEIHGVGLFGINSDFIRNHNGEFDRFYGPLTGYSLGTYFHFIVKFNNIANMKRQMAVAPDIL